MEAYHYPLLLKQLWHTPLAQAADQEIVYRDLTRFTFRELRERIGRLASGLAALGVTAGDTVGMLDWDSNRYLEAYFAVPMMGAVLHTVNVRLTPEQIAYTIDHGGASVLLVNEDFVPMLESIRHQLPKVKRLILMSDKPGPLTGGLSFDAEYEELLISASPDHEFVDFDENRIASTFYTTGTTGKPKGVRFSHRQLVLHTVSALAFFGMAAEQGRFSRDDVYMPLTPMFHAHAWGMPWTATVAGGKQVYPGRYDPALLVKLIKTEGVTFTHGVPTLLQMLLDAAIAAKTDLAGLKMSLRFSAASHSPRPFGTVDDAVAISIVLSPCRGVPVFFIAQPTVTVRVEDSIARFPLRPPVSRVKTAAVPTIGILGLTDPSISVRVPACIAAYSISVPLCCRDPTVGITVNWPGTGRVSRVRIEGVRDGRNVATHSPYGIAAGK